MLRLEDDFPAVAPVDMQPQDEPVEGAGSPMVETDTVGMQVLHAENDRQKGIGLKL